VRENKIRKFAYLKRCSICESAFWTASKYSIHICEDCFLKNRTSKRGKYPRYLSKIQAKKYEKTLKNECKDRITENEKKKINKTFT